MVKTLNWFERNPWIIPVVPLGLVLGALVYFGWPRQQVAEVVRMEWHWYYQIQSLQTVRYEGESYVPYGGREIDSYFVTECSGFDKDRTCSSHIEYDYYIEEYRNNRQVGIEGPKEMAPYWVEYTLNQVPTGPYGVGVERLAGQYQVYTLYIKGREEGEFFSYRLDRDSWNTFDAHETIFITTSFGTIRKIRKLEG